MEVRPIHNTTDGCVTFLSDKYSHDEAQKLYDNVAPRSSVFLFNGYSDIHNRSDLFAIISTDPKRDFFLYAAEHCPPPNNDPVIGAGCDIHPSVVIYPNVVIGNNVTIKANSVIGGDGFGIIDGKMVRHYGGVVIGDDVHIGSCTCIDRGTLGDTIIGNKVKIDNLVHIAHNVVVKYNAVIIANSMIAGSVTIGRNAWIAPSASVINAIDVGDDTLVGMGGVVVKPVRDNAVVYGNPAREKK